MKCRIFLIALFAVVAGAGQASIIYSSMRRGIYAQSQGSYNPVYETFSSGEWNRTWYANGDNYYHGIRFDSNLDTRFINIDISDQITVLGPNQHALTRDDADVWFSVTQNQQFLVSAGSDYDFIEYDGSGTGFSFSNQWLDRVSFTLRAGNVYSIFCHAGNAGDFGWGSRFSLMPVPECESSLPFLSGLFALSLLRSRRSAEIS